MYSLNKKYFLTFTLLLFVFTLGVGCKGNNITQQQLSTDNQHNGLENKTVQSDAGEVDDAKSKMTFISSGDKLSCTDCHSKTMEQQDHSLIASLAKLENHPKVSSEDIAECASCHRADNKNSLVKILHSSHYGGADNHFVGVYEGACIHCHKLAEDGTLPVAGLESKGTAFLLLEVASVDQAPNGCLDCHTKTSDDKDRSLNAVIAKIEGHTQMRMTGPADCLSCHEPGTSNAFGSIMHKLHLQGEHYKDYGNSCINCHDKGNKMAVKGI